MDIDKLKAIQINCAKKVIKRDEFEKVRYIGGMDITFEKIDKTPTKAWASLVVVDMYTLKPVYKLVIDGEVTFPYVPTFLAFRELPMLKELHNRAETKPDIYFIDGQGIAHPRGCGIASHFGIETNTVSVGVAKTKLFGYYKEPPNEKGSFTYLKYKDHILGAVVRTKEKTAPIFVSVGHKISLKTAIDFVLKTSIYRIPEPTRLAHNLLQKVRKGNTLW